MSFQFPEVKYQSVEFFKDLCSGFSLIDLSPHAEPRAMLVTKKYCIVPVPEKGQMEQI